MVHALLQRAIKVGERLRARAEAHGLAQIVPSFPAIITLLAHYTALNRHAHAHSQRGAIGTMGHTGTKGGDDAGGFVAEDEGRLDAEVAVAAVGVVVKVGAAEACGADGKLGFARGGGPEGAALEAEVVCTVADEGGGGGEGESGRHCWLR